MKPSKNEEEYFARIEIERRKTIQEKIIKELAEEDKKKQKELHYMRCPKCGMELSEIEFKGVKIDKCFQCEGLWLDSGEMDALSKLEKTTMDKLFSIFKK